MTWQDKLKALNELSPTYVRMTHPKTWTAKMPGMELKDGVGLISFNGQGETAEVAVDNLWKRAVDDLLRGQCLVIGAYTDNRREVFWNGEKWVKWGDGT